MGDQLKFVQLEMMVVALGLLVLIADLAMAPSRRRLLGYLSAVGLFLVFLLVILQLYNKSLILEGINVNWNGLG